MDGEALVGHVVPVLRSGNILEVRRRVASLVVHLRGMHDDLNVAAELICERMKGPKASSDVVGLALAGAAAALEAVPRIDLQDARAVAHDGDLRRVDQPFELRALIGMLQEQVMLVDPNVGLATLLVSHQTFEGAAVERAQDAPQMWLCARLERRDASDEIVGADDVEPNLRPELSFAVAWMSGCNGQRAGRQAHLAFPFRETWIPQRQWRRLGQFVEPIEPGNGPRQRPLGHKLAQSCRAIGFQNVVRVLAALRPFDEMKPRGAQRARHIGPQRKARRIVVAAPNKPGDAIEPRLQRVVDIAVPARAVVGRPLRGATRNGQNFLRVYPGFDERTGIELALGDKHYVRVACQYAGQIPERQRYAFL